MKGLLFVAPAATWHVAIPQWKRRAFHHPQSRRRALSASNSFLHPPPSEFQQFAPNFRGKRRPNRTVRARRLRPCLINISGLYGGGVSFGGQNWRPGSVRFHSTAANVFCLLTRGTILNYNVACAERRKTAHRDSYSSSSLDGNCFPTSWCGPCVNPLETSMARLISNVAIRSI